MAGAVPLIDPPGSQVLKGCTDRERPRERNMTVELGGVTLPILTTRAKGVLGATGLALLRIVPAKMASDLLAFLAGRFGQYFIEEKIIRKNLRTAFPDLDGPAVDANTKKIVKNFGRVLAEIIHIPTYVAGKQGTNVSVVRSPDNRFKQSDQAIYVTAHLGNWELIPIALPRSCRLLIIYSRVGNRVFNDWLLSQRRKTGAEYVEKSMALKACVKALKQGGSIALLVDHRVKSGVDVSFLGNPTIVTDLPARLALKFNCPIVPTEAVRTDPRSCQVMVHEPIWPGENRGEQAVRDLTQRMASVVGDGIRKRPDQWCCDKRRWRKRKRASKVSDSQADQGGVREAELT